MDIRTDWTKIRNHFRRSFGTSLHYSISSVDKDNNPTTTPIGSLFLNNDQTGFYFERYPSNLPKNSKHNKNICVLAVNSSKWLWLKSLYKNKFSDYPAIKLYGTLGEKRQATENELRALKRRMRKTRQLQGHKYLWSNMDTVRDIFFTNAELINLGKMTKHL